MTLIDRPETSPARSLFDDWVGNRTLPSLGTNSGAKPLAFQSWHRFKEAFAPEFVRRAIEAAVTPVCSCLDPFGGSGTTALAAQFLGVESTTVEVNPFLADVIRAKLTSYDTDELMKAVVAIRRNARSDAAALPTIWGNLPATFIEPGVNGRWLFDRPVAEQVARLLSAIHCVEDENVRRLFRVVLGGMLVDISNVVVSGKGRRYRRNWTDRSISPEFIDRLFLQRAQTAVTDVHQFGGRPDIRASVIHGDVRQVDLSEEYDLAVCSPPYPNSFDYTDVYNIELWMLGYLASSADNRSLRGATLSSHVQLHRDYAPAPAGSETLDRVLGDLAAVKSTLWSPWIPAMIGAYFADLSAVMEKVGSRLRATGSFWMVVGDSRYGGVDVPTAVILSELAAAGRWKLSSIEPFRAMKSSAQQGGSDIPETLLVFGRS